jgi:hypothetical protein
MLANAEAKAKKEDVHPEEIRTVDIFGQLHNEHHATYEAMLGIAEILLCRSAQYPLFGNDPMKDVYVASNELNANPAQVIRPQIAIANAREQNTNMTDEDSWQTCRDNRLARACYCILQCAMHYFPGEEVDMDYDPFSGE